jgi:citrate lyase subunit beta / citryl-CoA lyase
MCIHPDQITGAYAASSSKETAVARVIRVVEAERKGLISIRLDGQFIDYPVVARVRRVLDRGAG